MEMFKSRTGIDIQHVPYKGTAGALQDTVGGRINVMFDVVGPLMPQVRSGKVKAIVVTAKERIPAASDVPTMAKRGVPDFVPAPGPASAPAGTRRRSSTGSAEVKKALADPGLQAKLAERDRGGCSSRRQSGVRRRGNHPLGQGDHGRQYQDGAVRLSPRCSITSASG